MSIPAAAFRTFILITASASFHPCFITIHHVFFFRPDTRASVALRRHRFSDSSQSSPTLFSSFHLPTTLAQYILVQNLTIAAAPIITRKPRSYIVGCRTEGATSQSTFQFVTIAKTDEISSRWESLLFPSYTGSIFWDYETWHASVQAIAGGKARTTNVLFVPRAASIALKGPHVAEK